MINYLADTSALWRLTREPELRRTWADAITSGAVGSAQPQRTEFRRSARSADEYDEMTSVLDSLYPDVPVPKTAWRWIESAQHRLARVGAVRALSTVDLLVTAIAAHHGLIVLHDDGDFVTASRHLPDVAQRRVRPVLPREVR